MQHENYLEISRKSMVAKFSSNFFLMHTLKICLILFFLNIEMIHVFCQFLIKHLKLHKLIYTYNKIKLN